MNLIAIVMMDGPDPAVTFVIDFFNLLLTAMLVLITPIRNKVFKTGHFVKPPFQKYKIEKKIK